MTVVETSPDVMHMDVSLDLELPELVSFPIDVGDVHLDISHSKAVIIIVDMPKFKLTPGKNELHIPVTVRW